MDDEQVDAFVCPTAPRLSITLWCLRIHCCRLEAALRVRLSSLAVLYNIHTILLKRILSHAAELLHTCPPPHLEAELSSLNEGVIRIPCYPKLAP